MKTTTKKTLFDFYEEAKTFDFDKKKVKGLVKRANSAGIDIYYGYHEDEKNTWVRGWSEEDYKKDYDDAKIFERTDLIQKSKGDGGNFCKSGTYTAECVIFIFCPLEILLKDAILGERKIEEVKKEAAKNAADTYKRAFDAKEDFDKWEKIPVENKAEILKLTKEISDILGTYGSRCERSEKNKKIIELGGNMPILQEWQKEALTFSTLEKYEDFKKEKAVENLLKSVEQEEIEIEVE